MIDPIVSPGWLREHWENVAICDVRTRMATVDPHAAFLDGHLPGARFVDLDTDLADPPGPGVGRHPLPSAERFRRVIARLGLAPTVPVVAYDAANGGFAGRLVWMLRILDRPAALLDGGLTGWDGALETGPVTVDPVAVARFEWPEDALATADDVAAHLEGGGVVVDSREEQRYRGEVEPIDAVAGHVPGAVNLPFADNLADGRFRAPDELRARFEVLRDDAAAIVYCGSGVTACHNALAMEHAGLPRPRVYVGSWSGWTTAGDRPVAPSPD